MLCLEHSTPNFSPEGWGRSRHVSEAPGRVHRDLRFSPVIPSIAQGEGTQSRQPDRRGSSGWLP